MSVQTLWAGWGFSAAIPLRLPSIADTGSLALCHRDLNDLPLSLCKPSLCSKQSPKELLADWRRMFTPAMRLQSRLVVLGTVASALTAWGLRRSVHCFPTWQCGQPRSALGTGANICLSASLRVGWRHAVEVQALGGIWH